MKLYGKLTPADRVMVIGCSTKPWDCEKNKDFKKMFTKDGGKMLFIPKPDYSSLQMIWKTLITKRGVKLPQTFDIQTLAHLACGMTAGKINSIVNDVVTDWRIQKVARGQTLHIGEFIQAMARQREVSSDEVDNFNAFRKKFSAKKGDGGKKKKKGGGFSLKRFGRGKKTEEGFHAASYKYGARRLMDKGVLISVDGIDNSRLKMASITISCDTAGIFKFNASVYGTTAAEETIAFQDLLELQYNNVTTHKFFTEFVNPCTVNVNLLIFLINKKFYNK